MQIEDAMGSRHASGVRLGAYQPLENNGEFSHYARQLLLERYEPARLRLLWHTTMPRYHTDNIKQLRRAAC